MTVKKLSSDVKLNLSIFAFAIFVAVIFNIFPQLDIEFSRLFFKPQEGFHLHDNKYIMFLYYNAYSISVLMCSGAIIYALMIHNASKKFSLREFVKPIYILSVILFGPGIITHTIFKDFFRRARPLDIMELGGNKLFTGPFVVSNQCEINCSFTSGHAATGFMLITLAFLFKGYKRHVLMTFAVVMGLLQGVGRVIQGKHFLSDIIFAGFICYFTAYVLDIILKPGYYEGKK